MTLTGGRRFLDYARPPAGTPGNSIPFVDPVTGFITWGEVVTFPTRDDYDIDVVAATPATWTTGSTILWRAAHGFKIASATVSCGVRLYNSAAARTADLSRPYGTDPDPGSGVLAETWLAAGNSWSQWQSPVPMLYNADTVSTSVLYWSIYSQMTGIMDITVTITALQVEA